jgi:glutathione S-transferase
VFLGCVTQFRRVPSRRGLQPNEARVSELLAILNGNMDAYDVILGKQKYLAGDVRFLSLSSILL